MRDYFFDTSALQQRYVRSQGSRRIRRIISDHRNRCYISEWTVLEIASALGKRCRGAQLDISDFDSMNQEFFRDVAKGRLVVRPVTSREIRRARDLLRFAGIVKRKSLSSGDALVATSCLYLAYELKTRVPFYLSDRGLFNLLGYVNAFAAAVDLRFAEVGTQQAVPNVPDRRRV
jgi:predicted nucleic acid-binding protein